MKSLNLLSVLVLTLATSLSFAASGKTKACDPDGVSIGARDPYGSTPAESISKEFAPRLKGFLSDCDVQAKLPKLDENVKIEISSFKIDGIMAELTYSIQDFKKHEAIDCKLEGGFTNDSSRMPKGPGPIATVAYLMKVVEVTCSAPYRN